MIGRVVIAASLAAVGCGRLSFDASTRSDAPTTTEGLPDTTSPDSLSFDTIINDGHLVGYWQFEDATMHDSSTFAHDGTCPYGCPGIVSGLRGNAADFHDLEAVEIGAVSPLAELATDFTLAGWVNLRSITMYGALISNDRDCSNFGVISGFSLWASYYQGPPELLLWNQGMTMFGPTGPSALPTGTWVFLAGTYDGTTAQLYQDGAPISSLTRTNAVGVPPSYPLRIGHQGFDYAGGLDGLVDEVMIFDRALTPTEISIIYAALKP